MVKKGSADKDAPAYKRIVLDSSVIHSQRLVRDELPRHIRVFLRHCADKNIAVAIPETVVLEFTRKQRELVEQEIVGLRDAVRLLESYDVEAPAFDPDTLVTVPDPVILAEKCGVRVLLIKPKDEELREAHRRASLHESPQRRDSKDTAMRDIVIWLNALSVAREAGGAILVSNDTVHINESGDEEAGKAGLVRVSNFDDALNLLFVETPSSALIRKMLDPVWGILRSTDLPFPKSSTHMTFSNLSFEMGASYPEHGMCEFSVPTASGGHFLGRLHIHVSGGKVVELSCTNLEVDGDRNMDLDLDVPDTVRVVLDDTGFSERRSALRQVIEGERR